jgi:phosphoglucosamine mutase
MKKYFGTDGVRGIANENLTPQLAFRLGKAACLALGRGEETGFCDRKRYTDFMSHA